MKALLAAATAAVCLFAAPAISSAAITTPVTFTPAGKNGPTTQGTLKIKQFQDIGGSLFAIGTVNYNNTVAPVAIPVTSINNTPTQASSTSSTAAAAATPCPVLNLVLGPLDLNILGLQVTLNQVQLNIDAIPGPGNLLGNLLCDVANLLSPGNGGLSAVLSLVVTDLNNILAAL